MPRKSFARDVQTEVLVKCRRRCALCFCLDKDAGEKEGQLAHIDRNPGNNSQDNAAFLCIVHHPRYDSNSPQTKAYSPHELKEYQRILYAYMESFDRGAVKRGSRIGRKNGAGRRIVITVEVYDRRVPIYHSTIQFVRDVLSDLRPELELILKFAADTDQALFLYDESVAEYLTDLFKRALRLHTVDHIRAGMWSDDRDAEKFGALVKEQTELASWFTDQHAEIRARFAPFLRLG